MRRNYILITGVFVIACITLVNLAFIMRDRLESLILFNNAVEHTNQVIQKLEILKSNLVDGETGVRGFLLTNNKEFLEPYNNAIPVLTETRKELSALINDNKEQLKRLHQLNTELDKRLSIMQENINADITNDTIGFSRRMIDGKVSMDNIRIIIKKMSSLESSILAEKQKEKAKYERVAPLLLMVLIIFSIVITIISFLMIFFELRRRLKYQHELEVNIAELNQSKSEIEEIAEVSSHDLQEPLRKIRMFSSRLLIKHNNQLDDDSKNSISRIDAATLNMQSLIDNLMIYTNVNSSSFNAVPVNLDNLCTELINTSAYKNKIEIKKNNLPVITGDEHQLRLLFANIIDNAIKYSKPGTAPSLEIVYEVIDGVDLKNKLRGKKYNKISFTDNGIGFDEKYLQKIFTAFRRLHNNYSGYDGKGIGLALAKKIMYNHTGFIDATSRENAGATFILYFPVVN